MTVRNLIERNGMITDLEITVRKDGGLLWDQLYDKICEVFQDENNL